MPGPLAFDFAALDERERMARRHQPDRLDDPVARVVALHEGARVGDDGQRPATEHRGRREPLVQLRRHRQSRSIGSARRSQRSSGAPSSPSRRRGEPRHEPLREQLVVAPDVEQRRDHGAAGSVRARPRTPARPASGDRCRAEAGGQGSAGDGRGWSSADGTRGRRPARAATVGGRRRATARRTAGSGCRTGTSAGSRPRWPRADDRRRHRRWRGPDRHARGVEGDADRAVLVGAVDARSGSRPAGRASRGRDGRTGCRHRPTRRRRAVGRPSTNASVVAVRLPWWATLSRSSCGRPLGEQARVDVFLDVAGQQEPPMTDRPQQDDRHVVDARCRCPAARPGPGRGSATARGGRSHRRPGDRPRRSTARDVPPGAPTRSSHAA